MNRKEMQQGVALGAPARPGSDLRAKNLKAGLLSKMDFAMLTGFAYFEDGAGRVRNRPCRTPTGVTRRSQRRRNAHE
jgi:hypothetical protein